MQKFTPKQYLEIDIATNYGLDKASWKERLQWFEGNRLEIEEGSLDDLKAGLLKKAKEPALVLGGIFAYRDTLAGQPTGYTVGMDATASGLQLLSVLINCPTSAALCNVIDAGTCVDAYTSVYDACLKRGMQNQGISRKDVKAALMTHLYGSKVIPREVFGEGVDLQTFYAVVNDLLPGANALNHALLSLWNPEALEHAWTLPDGFDVRIKVMADETIPFQFLGNAMQVTRKINAPKDSGLSIGANVIHSLDGMVVREMVRRCSYNSNTILRVTAAVNAAKQGTSTHRKKDLDLLRQIDLVDDSGFMAVRILELVDIYNVGHLSHTQQQAIVGLMSSLPDFPFDLITIHDCFRCHPNYANDLREQYRIILADISNSKILSHIVSQLAGKEVPVHRIDPSMAYRVLHAEYAIS